CAHLVKRQHAREMRSAAHRSPIDLRQREESILSGKDHVARPADSDAASQDEAVDGRDHGYLACAYGFERQKVASIELDDALGMPLHFLEIDARTEAPAGRADEHDTHI